MDETIAFRRSVLQDPYPVGAAYHLVSRHDPNSSIRANVVRFLGAIIFAKTSMGIERGRLECTIRTYIYTYGESVKNVIRLTEDVMHRPNSDSFEA